MERSFWRNAGFVGLGLGAGAVLGAVGVFLRREPPQHLSPPSEGQGGAKGAPPVPETLTPKGGPKEPGMSPEQTAKVVTATVDAAAQVAGAVADVIGAL